MSAPVPDKADVQRLVVYPSAHHLSRHFILKVRHPARARRFIQALKTRIAPASLTEKEAAKEGQVNIGFTFRGLEALELPNSYLRVFQEKAPAFAEGARRRATRRLGDGGENAAQWWEEHFRDDRAHVLLVVHADNRKQLADLQAKLQALPGYDALDNWKTPLEAEHLTDTPEYRTVHFGMRDLVAEPAIRGFHDQPPKKKRVHEPGEFLLGYKNDYHFNRWLLINPLPTPNPALPPLNEFDRAFFRNGSFGALRKMEQNEEAFRRYLKEWAKTFGVEEEYIKAKMTGRWTNGQLVKPGETAPPDPQSKPPAAELDDFDFENDKEGRGCPFGSHIRRMNPRDDPIAPSRLRPLLRRGMPYGPSYDKQQKAERGLLGLFFCASLEDQFEHLLVEWGQANPMGPANRGNAKDPLFGNHCDPDARFDIPVPDQQLQQLEAFTRFVTTRGTLYAFFPGIAALDVIAAEQEKLAS